MVLYVKLQIFLRAYLFLLLCIQIHFRDHNAVILSTLKLNNLSSLHDVKISVLQSRYTKYSQLKSIFSHFVILSYEYLQLKLEISAHVWMKWVQKNKAYGNYFCFSNHQNIFCFR